MYKKHGYDNINYNNELKEYANNFETREFATEQIKIAEASK